MYTIILVSAREVCGSKHATLPPRSPALQFFGFWKTNEKRRKYAVAGALGPPSKWPFGTPKHERELRFTIF